MRKISVPKPRRTPSGQYNIWLAKEKISVTADTSYQCQEKAMAIRLGLEKPEKESGLPNGMLTLNDVMLDYIYDRQNVISPSTFHGYETIRKTRFSTYINKPLKDINLQRMVSDEAKIVSPKTVRNAWGLVASSLRAIDYEFKEPTLPQRIIEDEPFLDYIQIKTFLSAINGKTGEMGALLALHGLRRSELLALKREDVKDGTINIHGAIVRGAGGFVYKKTNKNDSSTRKVPIMIPRLQELINDIPVGEYLVQQAPNKLYDSINRICKNNELPLVGVHGLRRSFASLCYHLGLNEMQAMRLGGWKDYETMRKIYTKLADADVNISIEKMKNFFENDEEV